MGIRCKENKAELQRYVRGYLFGKSLPPLRESIRKAKSIARHEKLGATGIWAVSGTPLEEYAGIQHESAPSGARLNFLDFLIQKSKSRAGPGPLKVLDIGGFSFSQWKDAGIPDIEVHGTTLTSGPVDPAMAPYVKICCAQEVHKFFPKNHFDIVVSHYSNYGQERDAVENALYVAAPGGEVLFSGEGNFYGLYQLGHFTGENPSHGKLFDIISYVDGRKFGGRWFFHLKKNADGALDELLRSAQGSLFFAEFKAFLGF
ncbi:Uncharacterised protein [uncultured archaeon]|nr:Uncharacterised protein [uncultured archaeon]